MILEAIWHGNFTPADLINTMEPEYRKASLKVCSMLEELKKQLNESDYQKVELLTETIYSAECLECQAYFEIGFSTGMRLEREISEQLKCFDHTD